MYFEATFTVNTDARNVAVENNGIIEKHSNILKLIHYSTQIGLAL